MGLQAQPDQAVRISTVVYLLQLIKSNAYSVEQSGYVADANYLWKVGAYVCILTTVSLCGHEGFYIELAGMRNHLSKGKMGSLPEGLVITKKVILSEDMCANLSHVTVALQGHFKGEAKVDHHLISIPSETQSGLKPRWWIERLVKVCAPEGRNRGPAFTDENGVLASSPNYNSTFQGYLSRVQAETILNDEDVDVCKVYNTYRTLKKTSTMRIE